ncbi:nucleoporin 88 [Aricia agestis]|uniref:nucleoporin 88 n=1 Tax=Aricia agestis TaxID=91739 RepID=UPI001C2034D1|nr:nucleoporin 88 [Aricia agestis]
MSCVLYETKLANHQIFLDIKNSLSEETNYKLRNLIELKDEILYVWNSVESCLFCLNVKHLDENEAETPYQKLHLVSPPAFAVERLMSSECGTRLCLWGSRGVTVVELPSRWGRSGLFDSGNQTVLCKSFSLDERLLYLAADIQRVHWHPKSMSHLLVLVSDNTMRLYNIALKAGPKLVRTFTVGHKPTGALGRTVLESLGDAAVDFTATVDSDHLLILTGNGDVYMMACEQDDKGSLNAPLKGPLSMYPSADDNYGAESCSILALGTLDSPTLVVIASAAGVLYHCLLLPDASEEAGDGYALYVVESVELNIAHTQNDNDMHNVYPVHLYRGPRGAYVCMHASGVHAVNLPLLRLIREYAAAIDTESDSILSAISQQPSSARHLLCTSGNRVTPPVGLAVTPAPLHTLLILCNSGEMLSRTLEPQELEEQLYKEMQLRNPALDQDDINNILKEQQKLSFTSIMQEVLAREASQPLLKLDKKEEPDPKECLEVLTEATVRLRAEYMSRQRRALDVITRKVAALRALAKQQEAWREDLQADITQVELQSAVLKEKRDYAEKFQDDMKYRCSAVFRSLRRGASSAAERRTLCELQAHARAARDAAAAVQQLKVNAARKSEELKRWEEEYQKKQTVLGRSHSDTISSILQQQTSKISTLIEETKLLKDQLGVA